MNLRYPTLAIVALLGSLAAQGTIDSPSVPFNPQGNNIPIGSPRLRYMQWYAASEFTAVQTKPIRITGFAFRAAPNAGGQAGRTIELEVTMGNSLPFQASGSFEGNFTSGRTVVFPRARVNTSAATPGSYPVRINFVNEFVWDGQSGVALDLRIYDNGNSNVAFAYDLEFHPVTQNRLLRLYTVNDPNSAFAAFGPQAAGITTRFFYNEAITVQYGTGCAGEGGFVPSATVSGGLPIPGNGAYTFELRNCSSQRPAVFFIGGSNTTWGSFSLPYALGIIGAPGCSVLAEPLASARLMTVGGGPGAGLALFPFPMPANTGYLGAWFYAQWAVLDPNSPNGGLAMSNGLWLVPALQ
ncbi:MAG: hypothetical protein IPM29_29545 [Planctomycetes bacterium]|nr:hypothetical protein [Planctomycetota bacterium]